MDTTAGMSRVDAAVPSWLEALERLRGIVAVSLREEAEGRSRTDPGLEAFRGLCIDADEIVRLLADSPGAALLRAHAGEPVRALVGALESEPRLSWLRDAFALDDIEIAIVAIAMAPEIDLRFERLYAFLQDDVSRRRARVGLCLNLLCRTPGERLERQACFDADAPLIRHRILEFPGDDRHEPSSDLDRPVRLDRQMLHFLLHRDTLDARLQRACRVHPASAAGEGIPLPARALETLAGALAQSAGEGVPARFYLQTDDTLQASLVAGGMAGGEEGRVLDCDLRQVLREPDPADVLEVAVREAWLRTLVLHVRHAEAIPGPAGDCLGERLCRFLARMPGAVLLSGSLEWRALGWDLPRVVAIDGNALGAAEREAFWRRCAGEAGLPAGSDTTAELARRFRLRPGQIARAVDVVAGGPDCADGPALRAALFAAAREQSGRRLADLAQRIRPRRTWRDIVLPADSLAQLREICARVRRQSRVLGEWGFGRRLSLGKGTAVLFAGPSGTGKTMTAEIIANELGLDLYRINLATIVSKYIGETEKNLERVFEAAQDANAVLLFDEAEALFGKRSEVRDAHDRYANIEVAYLLQRIEAHEGLAILSTNLRQNLDEAFTRRLAFIVSFPFPEVADRRRIWEGIFPPELPVDDDLDFGLLSERFKLSGGSIKNVALAAAFAAAEDDCAVGMRHVFHGTRREFQKQGKALGEAELRVPDLESTP